MYIYREELSFRLGISAERSGAPMTFMYKNALCLPGFCGAMTGRPYYASHYLDSDLADPFLPDKEFYVHLSQKQGYTVYDADELIAKLLHEECSVLPGRTNLEKFESHYLYYRNGIHFTDSWLAYSMSSWSILQSKKMLKLKYMLFPGENIKLQLDILYLLNPEIAAVEFGTDKYNEWRKELHLKYHKYPADTIYDAEKLDMLRASFENMKSTHRDTYESKKQKDFKGITSEENVLGMLKLLVNQNGFDRNIAFQIYCYIKCEAADLRKSFLLRKICSLYNELNC